MFVLTCFEDVSGACILQHFEHTNRIIEKAENEGSGVLVHCKAGVSRSVSTCIAYLLYKHHMDLESALLLMVEKNPRSNPNKGFRRQLEEFEAICKRQRDA